MKRKVSKKKAAGPSKPPARPPRFSVAEIDKMVQLYQDGKSLVDIGKSYGVRPQQIRGYLITRKVKMRTTKETVALKKKKANSKK
jgi:hypothetical protein